MRQVLAEYEKELAPLEAQAREIFEKDLSALNDRARALNIDFVVR